MTASIYSTPVKVCFTTWEKVEKPTRVGVYMVQDGTGTDWLWAWWSGKFWGIPSNSFRFVVTMKAKPKSKDQAKVWLGLGSQETYHYLQDMLSLKDIYVNDRWEM